MDNVLLLQSGKNCVVKPTMNETQIEICQSCRFISMPSRSWCSKLGFYIRESRKKSVIQPSKKILLPDSKIQPPIKDMPKPSITGMADSFAKAMLKWGKSGLKCVSKDEYVKRRTICAECTTSWRCPYCGCMLWAKVALATEKCPEKKW